MVRRGADPCSGLASGPWRPRCGRLEEDSKVYRFQGAKAHRGGSPRRQRLTGALLLNAGLLLLAGGAWAGNISFSLSLTGERLSVVNSGDSSAYAVNIFCLEADGHWQPLAPVERPPPAELAPTGKTQFLWREVRPLEQLPPLARLQTVMVRFFDQAGVGFGQLSFFHAPPMASPGLNAGYVGGLVAIEAPVAPAAISATWVIWPQEDGIAPIAHPLKFDAALPPSARRIEWSPGAPSQRIDAGAGRPALILLHETAQGYRQQRIAGGWAAGAQQRSLWLGAANALYALALGLALAAALALLLPAWRARWRR